MSRNDGWGDGLITDVWVTPRKRCVSRNVAVVPFDVNAVGHTSQEVCE